MIRSLFLFAVSANVTVGNNGTYGTGLPKVNAFSSELQSILQIVFGIIGSIAVIVIIVAGFMFVTSSGKPENAAKAREVIIYALIGIAVSLMAEIIVSFVLNKVGGA